MDKWMDGRGVCSFVIDGYICGYAISVSVINIIIIIIIIILIRSRSVRESLVFVTRFLGMEVDGIDVRCLYGCWSNDI